MTRKSENSTSMPPPPPPNANVAPKNRMKLIIASAVIIIVVIAAILGYWLFLRPGGGGGGNNSWIFKGAYANFQGQGTVTGFDYTINMTIHEEVLDFNSTHAQIRTSTTTDMGLGSPYTSNSTLWVDFSKNDYNIQNGTLINSYDTTVTVGNLGTRNCKAYEYSISGGTETVYVDKTVLYPIKFSMTSTGTYSYNFDIVLVSTNIPGLQ